MALARGVSVAFGIPVRDRLRGQDRCFVLARRTVQQPRGRRAVPGLSEAYHTTVAASAVTAAEIWTGRIPVSANVSLILNLNAKADLPLLNLTYNHRPPLSGMRAYTISRPT